MNASYPLIITLQLDAVSQAFFNAQRKAYFPANANYLDAHVTLFYRLPSAETLIRETLINVASQQHPFSLQVTRLQHIGNGVVYVLESEELKVLHRNLQTVFAPWLIKQDQQTLRPHITIQNKVTAFKSLQLHRQLSETFTPFAIQATGICTWKYLKGPWKAIEAFAFTGH